MRAADDGAAMEGVVARPLDDEAGGTVRAAPDDGAIVHDVADLQAPALRCGRVPSAMIAAGATRAFRIPAIPP